MRLRLATAVIVATWLTALPVSAAQPSDTFVPFTPYADEFASAMVMVPGGHEVLYTFKPDMPRVPASLTKLANALAFVKLQPSWNKVVAMSSVDEVGGGRLRVASGARMTVRDLFYASITASANNAATALARLSGIGSKTFIRRMNTEATKAGASHSQFFDASGMEPKNRTTARDMALIAEKAFNDPVIRSAASSAKYEFVIRTSGERKTLKNTNRLLTVDPDIWILGGKTGYLEESLYNIVIKARPVDADGRPVLGKDLIVVVMGSPGKDASFDTAKRLAQWAWANHGF